MKTRKRKNTIGSVLANIAGKALLAAAAFALLGAGTAQAGYVTIGDPGNADDNGYGGVDYTYSISKNEVSDDDYESVMNSGTGDSTPKVNINLYGAKQFANALTEAEHEGSSAYNLYSSDGKSFTSYTRSDAINDGNLVYAIPTEDEWYKAAYGDQDGDGTFDDYSLYANADATTPPPEGSSGNDGWNYDGTIGSIQDVGFSSEEQNGTYDMMGNVWEWQEDTATGVIRGGNYEDDASKLRSSTRYSTTWTSTPKVESNDVGFRVVAIPEPASGALLLLAGGMVWFVRRKLRA